MNKKIRAPILQKIGMACGGVAAALLCLIGGGCGNGSSGKEDIPAGAPTANEAAPASPAQRELSENGGGSGQARDVTITDVDGEEISLRVDEDPPKGHPSDFFPTESGARWDYVIKPERVEPLVFAVVAWPMGTEGEGKILAVTSRGLLYSRVSRESYGLQVSVKGPSSRQGPLQFPKGVELSIGRDDLGVFHDCKQAFWAITESGRYEVTLVQTFDPSASGAPGGGGGGFGNWGRRDGYSLRPFFFSDKPGIAISLNDAPDSLLFTGIDRKLPGYEGLEMLHFIRKVKPEKKKPGEEWNHLDEGFREDIWFARGKGLVRLVQKVKGKTSMTMNLASFRPGRE